MAWVGGVVGALIGSFTSALLCGLGATAAVLGLIGCWITLRRIKSGACRSDHPQVLFLLAFWPVVIAISVFSLSLYFVKASPFRSWFESFQTWQPFVFFLLA